MLSLRKQGGFEQETNLPLFLDGPDEVREGGRRHK